MFQTEDHWANWLGGGLLLFGVLIYFSSAPDDLAEQHRTLNRIQTEASTGTPYRTLAYYDALDAQSALKASRTPAGDLLTHLTAKPGTWSLRTPPPPAEPAAVLRARADSLRAYAENRETSARRMQWRNSKVNGQAELGTAAWRAADAAADRAEKRERRSPFNLLWNAHLLVILALLFGLAAKVLGETWRRFLPAFVGVFALALLSYYLAAHQTMKTWGVGYAAWGIALGLLISNTLGTPKWLRPALRTELYIKTGLVLLGAEILFGKILGIGRAGIFVAWVVTPIVLVSTYWFGQRVLKIKSKTLNIVISADMSVCGVSAAVATAAAARAKREELTLAIGLSMIFTSVMMIVLPLFIRWTGMSETLGGAWLGGTLDSTGAVAAAGAFLGEEALAVATTIKLIQNVLIGVIAFAVAAYFARQEGASQSVGVAEIWRRFPRFILGFLGASVVFSIVHAALEPDVAWSIIDHGVVRGFSKNVRGWLFALAFVSIGLSTNFRELRSVLRGGKPLLLYVCGQSLNLLLTLGMAYLMFEVVF